MKTLKIKLLISLSIVFLSSGWIYSEQEHIPVGSRVPSKESLISNQQKKTVLESGLLGREGEERTSSALSFESKTYHRAYYYTSHPGAFHKAIGVSPLGETIELEDGSIWNVSSWDHHKVLDWLDSDVLVLSPNHSWFSSYLFRLTNQNTGASIQINLSLGPVYNGFHTHWITWIDHYNGEIVLEDGSIWNMSSFDSSVITNWLVNDTVIIGVNDGWLSSTRPNILINVNTLEYACGTSSY